MDQYGFFHGYGYWQPGSRGFQWKHMGLFQTWWTLTIQWLKTETLSPIQTAILGTKDNNKLLDCHCHNLQQGL